MQAVSELLLRSYMFASSDTQTGCFESPGLLRLPPFAPGLATRRCQAAAAFERSPRRVGHASATVPRALWGRACPSAARALLGPPQLPRRPLPCRQPPRARTHGCRAASRRAQQQCSATGTKSRAGIYCTSCRFSLKPQKFKCLFLSSTNGADAL